MQLHMKGFAPITVPDFAEASRTYCARREESGEGASTFSDGLVLNEHGDHIGRISYNGRIWTPGPFNPNDTPIWDNSKPAIDAA